MSLLHLLTLGGIIPPHTTGDFDLKLRARRLSLPLVLSVSLLAACGGKSEEEMMASAKTALQQQDAKTATIELKNLLQKNPANPEGRFLLGKALLDSGEVVNAEIELRRALEYKYPQEQVVPLLVQVMLSQGQLKKALGDYGSTKLADKAAQASLDAQLSAAALGTGDRDRARQLAEAAVAGDPGSEQAVLAQARILSSQQSFTEAVQRLDELLKTHPKSASALLFKAQLQLRALNEPDAAITTFKQLLAVKPDQFDAHDALLGQALARNDIDAARQQLAAMKKAGVPGGRTALLEAKVEMAAGNYSRAKELVQALRRAAPEHLGLLSLAAMAEARLGNYSEAEALAAKAVQLAPQSAQLRYQHAQALIKLRQPAKALAALKPLLESGSKDSEALALAGQAAMLQGEQKQAEEYFKRAASLRPDDQRYRAALAIGQLSSGGSDAAVAELNTIAAKDKGTGVDLALISALAGRRDYAAALKAIDSLERKQPDSIDVPLLRGRVQLVQGNLVEARKSFEAVLKKDPKLLLALGGLVTIDVNEKKPDQGRARLEAYIKDNPKNSQALRALAELDAQLGKPHEQVLKSLNEAVRVDPNDALARQMQLDVLLAGRDVKLTLSTAQAAVAAIPNNIELMERLARAQMLAGENGQALSTFGKITSLAPESGVGQLGTAGVQILNKDFTAAQRELKKVLDVRPDDLQARAMAIQVELQLKRPKEALALAKDLQSRHPKAAAGYLAEGIVQQELGETDPALASMRKALTLENPGESPLRLHALLRKVRRTAEADAFADSWLKSHPDDITFGLYLADLALATNDLPAAEKLYRGLLAKRQDLVGALNNLSWLLTTQKKPGAVELAQKALALAPEQPAVMDTYAGALAAEGQPAKALEVQRKVVQMAPDVPAYRLALARFLLTAGDKAAARQELQQLTKLGKGFAQQGEVEKLLAEANR